MKKFLMISVLCLSLISCSGCGGAIVGGIIGYQSGELLAGALIGVGFQHGEYIVGGLANGIGEMIANPVNDVSKAEIDSAAGVILLPKSAFTARQLNCMMAEFRVIFDENQWECTLTAKKHKHNHTEFMETWTCKREDGIEFEMTVLRQRNCKPTITIEDSDNNNQNRDEITIQIYNWLSSAVKRKC